MMGDEVTYENIPVLSMEIKNWPDPIKPPYVKKTTVKTYVVDPAGTAGPKNVQICDYEPRRYRMSIQVVDVSVTLTMESPVASPDVSTASAAPQGLYLPPNITSDNYEFNGPDAFWINSLTAVTRVTVVKEYC
jgi:hypothetical protein